ncbi:phosphotransferase [Candidatus Saccharibacteria bacterium]|nr:phosphotransferase [Candidatus Saccharibacteria bacterium]
MVEMEIIEKTRPPRYQRELEEEYKRLKIASTSLKYIKTPRPVNLTPGVLYTEKMPGHNSVYFKHSLPVTKILDEYVKILKMLSKELLKTTKDFTPNWVNHPKIIKKGNLHPDFKDKTIQELEAILKNRPNDIAENYGLVHGDLCPVNIMMDNNGAAYGLVDLGDMHMGDRRLDIAVLSWTIRGNFGPEAEKEFFRKVDESIDASIIQYYRLIYDMSLPEYKDWSWIKK